MLLISGKFTVNKTRLILELNRKCPQKEGSIQDIFTKEISDAIIPLIVDASAEYLCDETETVLENIFGSLDDEECLNKIQDYLLENCFNLIYEHSLSREYVFCNSLESKLLAPSDLCI